MPESPDMPESIEPTVSMDHAPPENPPGANALDETPADAEHGVEPESTTDASAQSEARDLPATNVSPEHAEPAGDTMQELLQRAQRTHELIAALDLKKVAEHDPAERDKLNAVSNALQTIASGEAVGPVEGVDQVATLGDSATNVATLTQHLDACGLTERIGRVWCTSTQPSSMKPLEIIPHREGLPPFEFAIAPLSASGKGYFGLFVDANHVYAAQIAAPNSHHLWHVCAQEMYGRPEELVDCLTRLSENTFEQSL